MITVNNVLPALALALAVTAFASPSFAQRGEENISAARAKAIHDCSVAAQKYREYTWGDTDIYVYGTCMAEHGQKE